MSASHHHGLLDDYSTLDSAIHRLPAAIKLLLAFAVILATVLIPIAHVLYFVCVGVALILVAVLSRVPPFFLIKRISLLEPIVLGMAVLALFQPRGGLVFTSLVVKNSLCLVTMILLSNTTPFAELLSVFRRLHLPALLLTTIALMYRYLFVLGDEASRMKRARASRTFTSRKGQAWRVAASVVGQLFVRANERSERIYAAMCARGWK